MSTNSSTSGIVTLTDLSSGNEIAAVAQKIREKKLKLLLIVGASRAGKSRLASLLALHPLSEQGVFVSISQDECYKDSKAMPSVRLQGAPYIEVANWDVKASVNWQQLCARVVAAINSASNESMIVVEGTMLIECDALMQLATDVVCIEIDKWECFERRSLSSRRQRYLPYMLEMWHAHCKRFKRIFDEPVATAFMFLSQQKLQDIADGKVKPKQGQSAQEFLTDLCCYDPTDFIDSITDDSDEKWFQPESLQRRIFGHSDRSLCGDALIRGLESVDFVQRTQVKTLMAIFLGVALGDASGAPFEFHRVHPVVWEDGKLTVPLIMSGAGGVRGAPAGAITDDFQMTLLAVKTLIANNMRYDSEVFLQAYIDWASDHPGGIGRNTAALFQHSKTVNKKLPLEKYRRVFDERHQLLADCSKSNGTLMRASAFVAIPDIDDAIKAAVADALLSNSNTVNAFVNAIYVWILHHVVYQSQQIETLSTWLTQYHLRRIYDEYIASNTDIRLRSEEDAKEVFVAVHDAIFSPALEAVRKELHVPECDIENLVDDKDKKGYVLVALWVALRFTVLASRFDATFGETIRRVVCLGGDTDTNAAITGALLATNRVHNNLLKQSLATSLDVLCETESYNLTTLMNVPYRYTTIKNVGNLIPARLGDELALLPAAWAKFWDKKKNPDADVGSIADPLPVASTTKKRPSDDDDNDVEPERADDDEEEEAASEQTTKRAKK